MNRFFFFSFALVTLAAGCSTPVDSETTSTDDEQVSAAQQALGQEPPKGSNGHRGFCTWHSLSRAAQSTLANQALTANGGHLPDLTILDECRAEVLSNMVECALAPNQSVTDIHNGFGHVYTGHWGLAPTWYSAPLSATGRRWVTACMVQRLNAFGVHVPILLEGALGPIAKNPAYQAEMPFEESIAWGDLFTVTPLGPSRVNVCYNDDLERACHANMTHAWDWLKLRVCDTSDTCGLNPIGPCSEMCPNGANGYPSCEVSGGTETRVIKVRLQTRDACGG